MRSITIQGCLGLALVVCTLAGLGYVGFRQLSMRGTQAEARLMLSYMQTLQNVYHIEQGQFARFDQFYGAPLHGEDHCEQPEGAARLGFLLHGCHDLKSPAPRYAYRSLPQIKPKAGYRLEAEGGTDAQDRSLVCFGADDRELWVAEQNTEIVAVQSCW
ncbi:MAG TPA: hypothetical protein VE954_40870 [Oligoflexus sp.]|uniref:hypothetical protein n=1 Tax=Oligoflexus sp. TaxID=1971216 RepID=UPI002D29E1BB|nr:hypothetical protein [Oligoflexus sp.]HYX39494.1 hypothetical protein [Oligoflexus sp.]